MQKKHCPCTIMALTTFYLILLLASAGISAGELVKVGHLKIPGVEGFHMHVDGDYLYIVRRGYPSGPETFSVVNIVDKSSPAIEGKIDDLPFHNAFDLWYGSGYAYTAHRFGGVTMIDVSDPAVPFVKSTAPSTYTFRGIMSIEDYLYVADHSAGANPGGMRIFDISQGNLNQVGALLGPPHGQEEGIDGRDLAISSDGLFAYQSSGKDDWGTARLYTYDISDKTDPSVLSWIENIYGGCLLISPDDLYLYMTFQEPDDFTPPALGVKIYSLVNRSHPAEVCTISLTNAIRVALDNCQKILYIGVYEDGNQPDPGIYVFDVLDPSQPSQLYYLRGGYGDIFYCDHYLYVEEYLANGERELGIYSDYEIVVEASVDLYPHFINKNRNRGVMAAFIELVDPYNVRDIDRESVKIIAVEGEDLLNPVAANRWPWFYFDHNRNGQEELMVVFQKRKVIEAIGSRSGCLELTLTGDINGRKFIGVDSVKVFDRPHPVILSKNDNSIGEFDNTTTPLDYQLGQNYPNPFNSETSIDYQLSQDGHVVIEIFNSRGRKIKTLVNKKQQAGFYSIHWSGIDDNGNRVVSGVYFYKMVAGSFVSTKKLIVLE